MSNNYWGNDNNEQNEGNSEFRPVMMYQMDLSDGAGEIRKESFFHFIKSICCPHFTFKSVIFFVSVIDLIVYIATICFGIEKSATEILAPKFNTLDDFGMKYPYKIYQGQLHRLILFGILHANLVHIISNLISQFILGSVIEAFIGSWRAGVLYLVSNCLGGLFSCVVHNAPGVGASVAIFGILGAYFGFMLVNWNYLDEVMGPRNKFCNLIFMLMIVILNISYGFNNKMIDNYGHLGGLIYGFLTIFLLIKPIRSNDGICCGYRVWFYIMLTVFSLFTISLIIAFWFVVKPKGPQT